MDPLYGNMDVPSTPMTMKRVLPMVIPSPFATIGFIIMETMDQLNNLG